MRSGKRQVTEGIEIPNQEKNQNAGEKETYKDLEILKGHTIKQVDMKGKNFKSILELLETKFYSRKLIKEINTWAVPLVRCSGPFLKWTREEL